MTSSAFQDLIKELLSSEHIDKTCLHHIENYPIRRLDLTTLNLIDKDLFYEIKGIVESGNNCIYFGKTLTDIKCVITEENDLRQHEVFVKYMAPKKLVISSVNLPYSPLQDKEFKNMEEILSSYQNYVDKLAPYFDELVKIDQFCTVMEPQHPSFKDDYRRVLLDARTWLHVEVTPEGLATNIHLVGHSDKWYNKLQKGLLAWDHDKDIVDNIMIAFDLSEFPVSTELSNKLPVNQTQSEKQVELPTCGICLCGEIPDIGGVPQPLCQNPSCGVYFHRECLYQWLVACSGSRPPAFGVATGACPTCLQPITCSKKDT